MDDQKQDLLPLDTQDGKQDDKPTKSEAPTAKKKIKVYKLWMHSRGGRLLVRRKDSGENIIIDLNKVDGKTAKKPPNAFDIPEDAIE